VVNEADGDAVPAASSVTAASASAHEPGIGADDDDHGDGHGEDELQLERQAGAVQADNHADHTDGVAAAALGAAPMPEGDGAHGEHADDSPPGGDDGHGAHETVTATDHHAHTGCADDHPATKAFVERVRFALDELYTDVGTLVARGYIPYFDALIPGGYPVGGGDGISHWIRPQYIEDGVNLDPLRPETVLLDDWWRPIGMMFIGDPNKETPPVYVNADGTPCSPWHPHTDYPARFGWWWYRMVYDDAASEGDMGLPEKTPVMMHVWGIDNPHGVYSAHKYPPRESREGPPPPLSSYFRDGTFQELITALLNYVP